MYKIKLPSWWQHPINHKSERLEIMGIVMAAVIFTTLGFLILTSNIPH